MDELVGQPLEVALFVIKRIGTTGTIEDKGREHRLFGGLL
jgi:hypothetical protein